MRQENWKCAAVFAFGIGPLGLTWACSDGDSAELAGAGGEMNDAGAANDAGGSSNNTGGSTSDAGSPTNDTGGSGAGDAGIGGAVVNFSGGTNGDAGSTEPGGSPATGTGGEGTVTGSCGDRPCACENGEDDDLDGVADGFDAECTGGLDDDEGTFATGIPGDNSDPKWQDCFFDGDSGAGNDGCRYSTDCLYGTLEPEDADCQVTDECLEYCAGRTPNGCDCFGCCTVQTPDGEVLDVVVADTCSIEEIADEEVCPRCMKSTECGNECGDCELCPGRTVEDLPESCNEGEGGSGGGGGYGGSSGNGGTAGNGSYGGSSGNGGTAGNGGYAGDPGYTCDGGEELCGPSLPACGSQYYCLQGCCLLSPE